MTHTEKEDLMDVMTPGEILLEEFLKPLNLKQKALAKAIGVPESRVSEIIKGNRRISAELAVRLSLCFGNSAEFWIGLQNFCDLEKFKREKGELVKSEVHPLEYA